MASLRKEEPHLKIDERILGDSEIVESVLRNADEKLERCRRWDIDLKELVQIVADKLEVNSEDIRAGDKRLKRVAARSILCFWVVKELGCSTTEIAGLLGMTQSAVSRSVQHRQNLAREKGWRLDEWGNA